MTNNYHLYRLKHMVNTGLILVLTVALSVGCTITNASGEQAKPVKTAPVAKLKMEDKTELDADIVSSSQVNVLAKVGGDVKAVLKKRGESVTQGEVILIIDSEDTSRNKEKTELSRQNLQAQMNKTREDISTNRGVLNNTVEKLEIVIADQVKSFNNIHNDFDAGLATKAQLEKAESQLKTNKLDLDTAHKQLANLDATDPLASLSIQMKSTELSLRDIDKTLTDFEVKAPISGVLTDLLPEQGITVPAGYIAGVVQQLNPIKVHADLTESSLKYVQGKSVIPFMIPGSNALLNGTVTYLADIMSPQSKTYVLELSAANADYKLKSGTRVKLQLGGGSVQEVVTVPIASIVKEGNDNYVFVITQDMAEKRKVTLGRVNDTNREVTDGIKESELVVVTGAQGLKDKDKVEVKK